MNKSIFERIPVKDVTDEEDAEYERRVMEIQQMKRESQSTEEKEHELWFDVGSHTEFFVVTEVDSESEFYKSFFKETNTNE